MAAENSSGKQHMGPLVVNVLSTGHPALDHRLFDKEARALTRCGVKVRIFAEHPRHEHLDGIELIPLSQGPTRLTRFLIAPWRAFRAVRRRPAPIVHIHDVELLQICPLLKLLGQPVIIYDVHEDFANMVRRRDWIPAPIRAIVRQGVLAAESLTARCADGIIGVTRTLTDKFPHRHRVTLYNLPSRDFILRVGDGALPPSKRPIDVMHLGVLSQRRMEFLASVMRLLLERRPGTRFRIVGPLPAQVAWLRSRFDPAVADVRGKVPYGQVVSLVRECKLGINVHPVVYPYLQVAVPVKVPEYMACGCGVVTSWLPEMDNLLGADTKAEMTILRNAGPPRYADALADWLDDLPRLDAAARRLREHAAERYCWESQAERLPALYRTLIAEKQRS